VSLIFFDGFNTTNLVDRNYWVETPPAGKFVFGASGIAGRRLPTGVASISYNAPAPLPEGYSLKLANIGVNSDKLYIGAGFRYIGCRSSGNILPVEDPPTIPAGTVLNKFIDFYSADNTLQFSLSTQCYHSVINDYYYGSYIILQSISLVLTSPLNPTEALAVWTINSPAAPITQFTAIGYTQAWTFLEFEIDMVASPPQFTLRQNGGLTRPDQNSTIWAPKPTTEYVELPAAAAPNIAAIKIYGNSADTTLSDDPYYGSMTSSVFGLLIDDLYVVNNAGAAPNTFLGADAVVQPITLNDLSPTVNQWSVKRVDPSSLALDVNDGDASYIRTAAFDRKALFPTQTLTPIADDPNIAGIKVISAARNVSLPAAYAHLYRGTDVQDYRLTPATGSDVTVITDGNYKTTNFFVLQNPQTSAAWTVNDINAGKWGVISVDPDTV